MSAPTGFKRTELQRTDMSTALIPANTIHSATHATKGATKVISTCIVEKGKPLATVAK